MAGNNYRLLLEAQLDPAKVQQQIKALSGKSIMNIKMQFAANDMDKLEKALDEIRNKASSMQKVTLLGDTKGGINQAVVQYKDALGNVVQEYVKINDKIAITQRYTEDLAKDEKEVNRILEKRAALTAKQKDEMEKIAHSAEKFLAKSQNMAGSPQLTKAQDTAGMIRQAATDGDINRVRELNKQLDLQKAALTGVRAGTDAWSSAMQRAMRQTIAYVASIASIQAVISQFREGIKYVAELNTEMTKIQLLQQEGAQTDEQIANLALQYNSLARSVGATTIEIAKGSVEWLRQGKSIQETGTLLKSTMYLSKLGALDSAQATEYLTAILNGFQMEASQAEDVVNKLVQVDNMAATSAGEMATALQYASAVAKEAGVSFENLTAMVATVSSTTRLAPEMIGTAFRTMMVRMQQVKAGAIDETGQSLNNVEKTLSAVGIQLRDTTDSFRPLEDVIRDVAKQWDTFTEVQKAQIGNAIAGQRQAQIFAVTMQNYGKVEEFVAAQLDSSGLAANRYAIYLESVEAAQNRVTAAWERLWQTSVSSGMLTWWLDFGATLLDVTTAAGGLNTILKLVIINLVAFNTRNIINGMTMMVASAQQGVTALRTLGTTATLTGTQVNAAFGIIGIVLSVGLLAWNAYQGSVESTAEAVSRLTQEISDLEIELGKTRKGVYDMQVLGERFDELKDKSSLTTQEQAEFFEIQRKIRDILPEVSGHFDEQGNFIVDETNDVKSLTAAMIELRNAQLAELQTKAQERITKQTEEYKKQADALAALTEQRNLQQKSEMSRLFNPNAGVRAISESEIAEQKRQMQETVLGIKRDFYSLSKEQQAIQLQTLRGISEWGAKIADEIERAKGAAGSGGLSPDERDERNRAPEANFMDEDSQNQYLGFLETVNKLTEDRATLTSIMANAETGKLELDQIQALAEAYPEYLDALEIENGQLKLNTDMVREYMIAKAEAAIVAAELNGATKEEIAVLQLYADQLRETAYVTVGNMQVATGQFNEMAWSIAQNAAMSGNSFVDLQGKALSSAEAIYQHMTSGDAAFNNFVQQAAVATGRSVQEIMNMVNQMISQTANNAYAAIQSINSAMASSGQLYNMQMGGGGGGNAPAIFTPAPIGQQFPGGLASGGGGGGGGGTSAADRKREERERKQEERRRKIEKEIEEARARAIDSLDTQLDAYKKIIDARKELLDTLEKERDYQEEIQDRNKSLLKLQSEITALKFDDSEEAEARRLQLQEQLAKEQQELHEAQRERSIEIQKEALDSQYEQFKAKIESMLDAIENINATSVKDFATQLAKILETQYNKAAPVKTTPVHHTGVDAGFVGDKSSMKSNEQFIKVLKGEVVVNPQQMDKFMTKTLPQITQAGGGDIEINMPINVAGNLDKTVLPDIERLVEKTFRKLNDSLMNRGYTRRAESFGQ
jgi:TP901 family phage tail tape measure protein